ncbi:MAG: hypothetical protein AAGG02_21110 [Cyanobacteria bacterium P01_H01_bin.15]
MSSSNLPFRLEQYTLRHPHEVLLIQVVTDDEPEEVLIFRGFSSSLTNPTAFDPDVPVISATAVLQRVDRLRAPYKPANPVYIEQDLSPAELLELLSKSGV